MAKSKKVEEASVIEEQKKESKPKKSNKIETVEKAFFIQRLAAFILDVFIVSMVASLISYPFLDLDSINKLNESSTQVVED